MLRWCDRSLFVVLLATAIVGAVGLGVLLAHGTVPDWLLPAAIVSAVLWPRRGTRKNAPDAWYAALPAWNRWSLGLGAALFAAVLFALTYGALASPSRHWDGAVAWDLKTTFLTLQPTLEQPFFRDGAVFCHSRDYPLLQPLLMALGERTLGVGRLVLPMAFAIAVLAIVMALLRRGVAQQRALLAGLAFALTPMLISPTSGAFDSGYADGLLAAWITVAVAGVVARDRAWIGLGVFLAVLTKPEGLPYGGALVAALWLRADSRQLRAAVAGLCGGALVWLPLQHDLHVVGQTSAFVPVALTCVGLGAFVLLSDKWLGARGLARWRGPLAAVAVPVVLLALPSLLVLLGDRDGSFGQYLAEPARALARLDRLPAVVVGALEHALLRGAFGLTWILPLLVIACARRQRRHETMAPLGTFLLLLVPLWFAPFFLSPIDDLQHHLRSTLPRLLLHATGVAWLFSVGHIDGLALRTEK